MRKSELISRRDLIKQMGFAAFILHPLLRSMAYAAGAPFQNAPRFVMFFKGPSFVPSQVPGALTQFAGTPLAALAPHVQDLILFSNMSIHGGSPKVDKSDFSYSEEHAAGLYGCVTGHQYKYYKGDCYYAYTDHESIDVRIAREYQARTALSSLPISSLHIGAGSQSDADSVGAGQKYISFRNRTANQKGYFDNAIVPVTNSGQLYDSLMQRINLVCSKSSNQPSADNAALLKTLNRKKSVLDLKLKDIQDAKARFGLDAEHVAKLDALLEHWRESEKLLNSQIQQAQGMMPSQGSEMPCPTLARPNGEGNRTQDLDVVGPVVDQMTNLIKLAFQWDLTRVVAFSISGASSGHVWPSKGVTTYHHGLEHANNLSQLAVIDAYYGQKFAGFLAALKSIDDGGGKNALYNSTVLMGQECVGLQHTLTQIPYILAGQGAGRFQTNRVVNANGRSNNDLLVSCLQASGVSTDSFGLASLNKGSIV